MKTLRLLCLSILLAAFCAATASAQQGGNDCTPGNTQSPPCAMASQSLPTDPEAAGESTLTTTASTTEVVTALALDLVEVMLAIF